MPIHHAVLLMAALVVLAGCGGRALPGDEVTPTEVPETVEVSQPTTTETPPPTDPPTATPRPTATRTPRPTVQPTDPPTAQPTAGQPGGVAGWNICYLIPMADVARITGVAPYHPPPGIAEPLPGMTYDYGWCDFGPAVRLDVYRPLSDPEVRALFDTVNPPDARQSVAGLGDEAYWMSQLGSLSVVIGQTWLQITLYETGGPVETAQQLAGVALARLNDGLTGEGLAVQPAGFSQCQLMSADEAAAIIGPLTGEPFVDGAGGGYAYEPPPEWCSYQSEGFMVSLNLVCYPSGKGAGWYFDFLTWQGGEAVAAGEAARWLQYEGPYSGSLVVLNKTDVIGASIFWSGSGDENLQELATEIVGVALTHLP